MCANGFDDVSCLQLLLENDSLTELDLTSNQIGDAGAAVIAQASQLTKLELRACGIGGAGLAALGQMALLATLDLGENNTSDLQPLCDGFASGELSAGQQLSSLDLSCNGITNDSASEMVAALAAATSCWPLLQTLSLGGNLIQPVDNPEWEAAVAQLSEARDELDLKWAANGAGNCKDPFEADQNQDAIE